MSSIFGTKRRIISTWYKGQSSLQGQGFRQTLICRRLFAIQVTNIATYVYTH